MTEHTSFTLPTRRSSTAVRTSRPSPQPVITFRHCDTPRPRQASALVAATLIVAPAPVPPRVAAIRASTHTLPPLSLPLPAPRLTRCASTTSVPSDPDIRTPTSPKPSRHTKSDPEFPLPSSTPKVSSNTGRTATPSAHPSPDHPPQDQQAHIHDLVIAIERAYISYSAQDELLQSPILLDSLVDFRERALDLLDLRHGSEEVSPVCHQPCAEPVLRVPGEEEVHALEDAWWSSAVVANWYGPQPHTVTRQKSRKKRRGRRVRIEEGRGQGPGIMGIVEEAGDVAEAESKKQWSLGGIDELGETVIKVPAGTRGVFGEVMGEREMELRRISSFVGAWDE